MGEDMYCQTRLFNRNSTYYYRAKIPVDLQKHYGKTERKFSLKTKDRAKAAALVRQFAARHEEEYARIRTKYHTPFQCWILNQETQVCNRTFDLSSRMNTQPILSVTIFNRHPGRSCYD